MCRLRKGGGMEVFMKAQTVRTKYGLLEGVREDGCIVFKGVPYAAPPAGKLRWRAPQPPKAWEGDV